MKEKEQAISPICETALDQMLEALAQGAFGPEDLEAVCRAQPDCAAELRASYILWQEMDTMTVPEPSEDMRGNFLKTLAEFEQEAHPAKAKPVITLNWNHLRWAAVFVVGLLIGLLVRTPIANEVVASEEEENVSTLLATENPTTDRLLAIQKIKEIRNPEDPIIEALHETLMKDPNVNVRLSAIEAMVHFIDHPKARSYLVSALPYQDSPIVQLTLAELLISLHSEQSIDDLKTLLNSDDLDHDVKLQLKETLNVL